MKKEVIKQAVDQYLPELVKITDEIYDLAEPGMEEVRSAGLLTDYLEKMGFQVEKGIAGLPTAFRAVYEQGQGGPSFGLLAEYDALKDIGHACGHHMQGPSVIGAARHYAIPAKTSLIRSLYMVHLQKKPLAARSLCRKRAVLRI